MPADGSEDPNYDFTDADALFAYTTSDTAGGYICVVRDVDDPDAVSCKHPAWGLQTRVIGVGTTYTLVKGPSLTDGTFRLLAEDSEHENHALSQPFTVTPCGDCDRSIGANAAQAAKDSARAADDGSKYFCFVSVAWPAVRKVQKIARGLSRGLGDAKHALSVGASSFSAGVSGAMSGGASVAVSILTSNPSEAKAFEILHQLSCGVKEMYKNIADDPPDGNYAVVDEPQFSTVPTPLGPDGADAAAVEADRLRAFLVATLTAYERYQGAVAANDDDAIQRQEGAAARFSRAYVDEIPDATEALNTYAQTVGSDPDLSGPALDPDQRDAVISIYGRIANDGFRPEEIDYMHSQGFTDADITAIRTHFTVDLASVPADATLQGTISGFATAISDSAEGFDQFAGDAGAAAARRAAANPPNQPPTAVSDSLTTSIGHASAVNVLANDSDPDGDPLSVTAWTNGASGTVGCTSGGDCTYTPNDGFSGADSFAYTVADGRGGEAQGQVAVSVVENRPPVAGDDFLSVGQDRSGQVYVLANDSDPDGQTLSVTGNSAAAHGDVSCAAYGWCSYTPAAGYVGDDGFTYTIDDGSGATATGHVAITVVANRPPVAGDDQLIAVEGTAANVNVLANDGDPDGDALSVSAVDTPAHGSATCAQAGDCTYTSTADYTGSDTFKYTVSDDRGATTIATVSVTVNPNSPPHASDDTLVVRAGHGGSRNVLLNDSDPDGQQLTLAGSTAAAHGAATCEPAGRCHFVPANGYVGDDAFTYTVSDGHPNGTATGTVHVRVVADPAGQKSVGTDFWVAFPTNYVDTTDYRIFVSGGTATNGVVQIDGLGYEEPFTVTPGQVTTIRLPSNTGLEVTDAVQARAVHVTSDQPVSVYGLSRQQFTTDAFLALPSHVLGTDYLAMAWGIGVGGSEVGVVASDDGTTVTVTPTSSVGDHPAGTPYTIHLDAGDAYQAYGGDLTGTSVTSDKPVAVLGGHQCADVPDANTFYCDHVLELLPPRSAWGRQFVTVPLATRTRGDTFRVLASEDGTNVTVDGATVATLNHGEFDQRQLSSASVITADKPVLVAQFSNGTTYDGVTSDPFMMLIPPYEQFFSSYTVTTPEEGFSTNFINLAVPSSAVGQITIDGQPVDSSSFQPIGSSGFSAAQVPVQLGAHVLAGPQPFGAFMYGYDAYDSYGYPGGLSLSPVAFVTSLTLTPPSSQAVVGTTVCVTATVSDNQGSPVAGIRVDFTRTGANMGQGSGVTDTLGHTPHCYVGMSSGTDSIRASVGTLSASAQVLWGTEQEVMTGRAYGAKASLLNMPIVAPIPDTGPVETPDASSSAPPCVEDLPSLVSAKVLCAAVTTVRGPASSMATASVASATVATGIPGVPLVSVTGVKATSVTSCVSSSGTTTIANLSIGGTPIDVSNAAPNTTVPFGVGTLVLNEQLQVPAADRGTTVNAIHLMVPGLVDVVLASATSDIHRCPKPPAVIDFDGDGSTDIAVFRPASATWFLRFGGGTTAIGYGAPGDIAVPADYDGDGRTDQAIFRSATSLWAIHNSAGSNDTFVTYGTPGDVPVPADYDGDGRSDVAVYRPSVGTWFIHGSGGSDVAVTFGGVPGDIPVVADYDRDGKADVAIFRPSGGVWYVHQSGGGDTVLAYGSVGDIPVVGDFDGDRTTDIGVFRPSTGLWALHRSTGGDLFLTYGGVPGDVPVAGDYDGDGTTDVAIFRPSSGGWFVRQSSVGLTVATTFGIPSDVPLQLPFAIRTNFFS